MDDYMTEPGKFDERSDGADLPPAERDHRESSDAANTPPVERADEPVLDRELVAQLEELDAASGDDVPSFVAEFLTSSVAMLENVRVAVAAEDVEGVKFHAHALKGSAATLGARRTSTLCAALETLVPEWDSAEAHRLVDRITTELDRAAIELGLPQLGPITARDR
jgi:HPt (histidine-containing phosphotransfer) domain-containing protein